MSPFGCVRECEVADLLHRGCWPDACPAELRVHVETCRICSDLVLVAGALQADRRQMLPLPQLESAGALWWRAQLRKRNAAIEKMARPILGAQLFAMAMAFVIAVALAVWQAGNWTAWIEDLPRALHLGALVPGSLTHSGGALWIVIPVLATIALLSGVVVYISSEKQ